MNRILSFLFIACISAPLILTTLRVDISVPNTENRTLAEPPRWDATNPFLFLKQFENYFTDSMSLRNLLLYWNHTIKFHVLKVSSAPDKAILGKKSWIFYTAEHVLDHYEPGNAFTSKTLEKIKENLLWHTKWFAERGVVYYVLIAPNKHSIYKEYLPDSIYWVRDFSRLRQLSNYLKETPEIKWLDLRDLFYQEKKNQILYYETGTHWNEYGSYLAYREFMSFMGKKADPIEAFNLHITLEASTNDLAKALGLTADRYKQNVIRLTPKQKRLAKEGKARDYQIPKGKKSLIIKETPNENAPTLVVFHDSFFESLIPFVSEHFKRSVYVRNSYLIQEVIEGEKPDIVIHELAERYIHRLAKGERLK